MKTVADALSRIQQTLAHGTRADSDWKESDHPRASNGQFGSGGGAPATPTKSTKKAPKLTPEQKKEKVKGILDALPTVPKEQNYLSKSETEKYSLNQDEVFLNDIPGVKTLSKDGEPWGEENTAYVSGAPDVRTPGMFLQTKIPLRDLYFHQPSVNKEKVEYFAEHYSKPKKGDAPTVYVFPNGNFYTRDHHRLLACLLRGDKSADVDLVKVGPSKGNPHVLKQQPIHFQDDLVQKLLAETY
jgi:hypothetical protein